MLKMIEVPTVEDWGHVGDDLDRKYAFELYAGKSNHAMQEHFREAPIEAFDELLAMPEKPLGYYILGYRDSVLAKGHADVTDTASAASSFVRLVQFLRERSLPLLASLRDELMPAVAFLALHQEEFGADVDIYGRFSDDYAQLSGFDQT
jgi:hypothetical protein